MDSQLENEEAFADVVGLKSSFVRTINSKKIIKFDNRLKVHMITRLFYMWKS